MVIPRHYLSYSEKTLFIVVFQVFSVMFSTVGGSNCSDTSSDENDGCDDDISESTLLLIISWGGLFSLCFLMVIYEVLKKIYIRYRERLSQSGSNKQTNILEISQSTKSYTISDSLDNPTHTQFGGIYYEPKFSTPTHAQYGGINYGRHSSTLAHAKYGGIEYGQHPSTPTHAQYGGFTSISNPNESKTRRAFFNKSWKNFLNR